MSWKPGEPLQPMFAVAAGALLATGCGALYGAMATYCPSSMAGKFDKKGYKSDICYLEVSFESQKKKRFIDKSWIVDNYDLNADSGKFKLKKGKAYCGERLIDRDGDGTIEKERGFFYELKLTHTRTEGVIWIQYFSSSFPDVPLPERGDPGQRRVVPVRVDDLEVVADGTGGDEAVDRGSNGEP